MESLDYFGSPKRKEIGVSMSKSAQDKGASTDHVATQGGGGSKKVREKQSQLFEKWLCGGRGVKKFKFENHLVCGWPLIIHLLCMTLSMLFFMDGPPW